VYDLSKFLLLFLTAIGVTEVASSTEIFEMYRSVRALGMGNAYSAVVENDDALFYNPAGIAKNTGFYVTIADPAIGLNGIDAFENYETLSGDSAGFQTMLNGLYQQPIWAGVNAKAAIMTPFFAAAYFGGLDASILAFNPVSPQLTANIVYDTGIAVGTGFTAGLLKFGAVAKRIERTGARRTFGPSTIASIIGGGSTDLIFDQYSNKGIGYSLDLGFNVGLPGPISPNLSMVVRNLGNTSFSTSSPSIEAPPTEPQEVILGASFILDTPIVSIRPAIDIKHLTDTELQLGRKVHMGFELDLPIIDLRAGLHQGYLSYGAGLNLGLFQIDVASWGVELGEYPGQFEDRRYMLQFALQIGFDVGLSGFGSGPKAASGNRGGSGASGRSSGFSKVKRRR